MSRSGDELAELLIRAIPAAAAVRAELPTVLEEAVARARAAWPQLDVDDAQFVTAIASGVDAPAVIIAAIRELFAEDLYLALACANGAAPAHTAFGTVCDAAIIGSLRQMNLSDDVVDEILHDVRTKLFVATERPPKIASYSGRAPLKAWARTIAKRVAIDRIRAQDDRVSDDHVLDHIPDAGDDPELAHLRATYEVELKEAFEEALATLDVRERNVLRHYFIDQLTIDEIGALYSVHKTTAFRWLESSRTALSKRTRSSFQRRVKLLPAELDSIVRLIQSHIDLSLTRVLAS